MSLIWRTQLHITLLLPSDVEYCEVQRRIIDIFGSETDGEIKEILKNNLMNKS